MILGLCLTSVWKKKTISKKDTAGLPTRTVSKFPQSDGIFCHTLHTLRQHIGGVRVRDIC